MNAHTIDGRTIAAEIIDDLHSARAAIKRRITLGVIIVTTGDDSVDPVVESFVQIKTRVAARVGVDIVRKTLSSDTTTKLVMDTVREFSQDVDGLIVQLPLPAHIDANAVLTEIPKNKDVDGINPNVSDRERCVISPVALAVKEVLSRINVDPAQKRAVVVGAGRLVGGPCMHMLKSMGADVSHLTLDVGKLEDVAEADLLVLGAGNPGMIQPEHIKPGVVIIDAGTSEVAGVVRGDADPSCALKASVLTPVPGGVGPIAVAMIFKNIIALAALHDAEAPASTE